MDIEALACDAVTVREGLLHILGGGVGALWRDSYPAPLNVDLALLLTLHPSEAAEDHQLRIILQDTDGKQIAQLDVTFMVNPPTVGLAQVVPAGQMVRVPLAVPMKAFAIPAPGLYSIEVLVDKQHRRSLPLTAMPPGAQPQQLPQVE